VYITTKNGMDSKTTVRYVSAKAPPILSSFDAASLSSFQTAFTKYRNENEGCDITDLFSEDFKSNVAFIADTSKWPEDWNTSFSAAAFDTAIRSAVVRFNLDEHKWSQKGNGADLRAILNGMDFTKFNGSSFVPMFDLRNAVQRY